MAIMVEMSSRESGGWTGTFFTKMASIDYKISYKIYSMAENNCFFKAVLRLASLSGDEIIWFGLPALYITCAFAFRLALASFGFVFGSSSTADAIATLRNRAMWEDGLGNLFGTGQICCTIEIIIKLIFKRQRPTYCKKQGNYVVPGEMYSMPSGHSVRAAALLFWFTRDFDAFKMLHGIGFVSMENFLVQGSAKPIWMNFSLIAWMYMIMFARIGLGKHYLSDVVAGSLVGLLVGRFLTEAPFLLRNGAKIIGGIIITAFWGFCYFAPLASKMSGVPKRMILILYYVFYFLMLLARQPDDWSAVPKL